MQFDLNRFLTKGSEPVRREFALECSGEAFPGYTVDSPCNVCFTARLEGSKAILEICLSAMVRAECARCLAPVAQSFEIAQQYEVRLSELQGENCDLPVSDRGMLDVDELARSEILLQVPQVLLCSDSCKGLCPVCGKPRILGCSCETQQADERLSVFEQLLS